jgi:hypothetical protein
MLDIMVWEQEHSMTVHLINLTNPMMMKGPVRELLPVGAQKAIVQLPAERQVKVVKLLRMGINPTISSEGSRLTVEVPSVLNHEVIAIDYV